jgi:hypothetical protein
MQSNELADMFEELYGSYEHSLYGASVGMFSKIWNLPEVKISITDSMVFGYSGITCRVTYTNTDIYNEMRSDSYEVEENAQRRPSLDIEKD